MITYELTLTLRTLSRQELISALKRSANYIFDKGGIIRRIDNLGERQMPYKTSRHGSVHRQASYFIFSFTAPPSKLDQLNIECCRDVDVIRSMIYKVENNDNEECTIEEEMKPPPYRPEVIKMLEIANRRAAKKHKFQYNSGLDYYPFQK